MAFKRKNRFDVQVAWPSGRAVGFKSDPDKDLTPEEVIAELEWFIARAKTVIASRKSASPDAKESA